MRLSPAAATYRSLATLSALQDLSKASYRGRWEAGEAFLENSIQLVVHFRRCIRSHSPCLFGEPRERQPAGMLTVFPSCHPPSSSVGLSISKLAQLFSPNVYPKEEFLVAACIHAALASVSSFPKPLWVISASSDANAVEGGRPLRFSRAEICRAKSAAPLAATVFSIIKKTIDAVSMAYVVHACLASFEETR